MDVSPNGSDGTMLTSLQKKIEELELQLFEKLENNDEDAISLRTEISALRNILVETGTMVNFNFNLYL